MEEEKQRDVVPEKNLKVVQNRCSMDGIWNNDDTNILPSKDCLLETFQVVVPEPEVIIKAANRKYNTKYIFPCLISLYIFLETPFLIYFYELDSDDLYLFRDVVMQFLPRYFRDQCFVLFNCIYIVTILNPLFLTFDRVPVEFMLFPVNDGASGLCTLSGKSKFNFRFP